MKSSVHTPVFIRIEAAPQIVAALAGNNRSCPRIVAPPNMETPLSGHGHDRDRLRDCTLVRQKHTADSRLF